MHEPDALNPPTKENSFHQQHVHLLVESLFSLTGIRLAPQTLNGEQLAAYLYHAPFALLSHGVQSDPIFNYANQTALKMFEMEWIDFVQLPSRESAEPINQSARAKLMARVSDQGYIGDYEGVRISARGTRFMIKKAVVWNVIDVNGTYQGQAATFRDWEFLPTRAL